MSTPNIIVQAQDSLLMVIDIQERLCSGMPVDIKEGVVKQVAVLLTAAEQLSVPVLVTEQYPKGLGATDLRLLDKLSSQTPVIEKTQFSSVQVDEVGQILKKVTAKQIILTGMETHICILQTALDLLALGYEVFVIADAVCSRTKSNYQNALERIRSAGGVISNTESVLFEWLGDAKHPHFRALSKLIL